MEFETLKKDNRKYFIIGSIVIILLASVIFFVGTKAKYRLTQKVNIASGTVNWHPPVFSIVSIKTSSDGTNYSNASSVPTSGYTLSNKSYCEVRGVKDSSATISYSNGKVTVNTSNINTKCYLYFDKLLTAKETILAGKTISTRSSFSSTLTTNTTGKIYTAEDNDGTSYYFAGAVNNNWVKFGGFYWRIIRINGDETIRLIYNGTTNAQTGTTTQIGTSTFNEKWYGNICVGYMYGTAGSSTYTGTHTNTNNSTIKQTIDTWYNTNLNKAGIKEHIDTNAGFCGDRTSTTTDGSAPNGTGGYASVETYYGPRYRLWINKTPSLKCGYTNDLYTLKGATKGNKALTYPVGLITYDEVALAGGVYGTKNQSYYLYTGQYYWTMSPYSHTNGRANIMCVDSSNSDGYYQAAIANGVRPVINLKADTIFKTGTNGTTSKPYEVV